MAIKNQYFYTASTNYGRISLPPDLRKELGWSETGQPLIIQKFGKMLIVTEFSEKMMKAVADKNIDRLNKLMGKKE